MAKVATRHHRRRVVKRQIVRAAKRQDAMRERHCGRGNVRAVYDTAMAFSAAGKAVPPNLFKGG